MKRILEQSICCFVIIIFLSSCGFQSIYKLDSKIPAYENENYKTELAAIEIKKHRKLINQQLRNNLQDALNPDRIKVDPKYLLVVNLQKVLTSTFTTSIGSSGRNRVILNASYILKTIDGEVLSTGTATAQGDFDVESKRFGNYTAEETIDANLLKIISQNIRNSLLRDIVNKEKLNNEK